MPLLAPQYCRNSTGVHFPGAYMVNLRTNHPSSRLAQANNCSSRRRYSRITRAPMSHVNISAGRRCCFTVRAALCPLDRGQSAARDGIRVRWRPMRGRPSSCGRVSASRGPRLCGTRALKRLSASDLRARAARDCNDRRSRSARCGRSRRTRYGPHATGRPGPRPRQAVSRYARQ